MSFDYDKYAVAGEYVKFENVGDYVVGIIKDIREGRTFNGDPCPELILEDDDGAERILSASQVLLRAALAEQRPDIKDKIRVEYTGVGEAKPGKAPPKQFEVKVKKGPHELQAPAVGDDAPF